MALSTFAASPLSWTQLAPIPDREGFAAPFEGVHESKLLVAGGANFPGKRPWEGGAKVWHDSVFVLEELNGQWKPAGKLPRPLAYGASLSLPDGVLCIGGSDDRRHFDEVFLLRWEQGKVSVRPLPKLPTPCANLSAAQLGQTIYVAGGIEKPDAIATMKTFWALDLQNLNAGWRELEPWPGPGRMLATAGAADGSFFLCSGAGLRADAQGKPVREWLRDAYRFTPGKGWKRLSDLPRVAVAAPSPAPVVNGELLVLGGDDGAQVNASPSEHKGFPRTVMIFDPQTETWRSEGEVPFSLVTTSTVEWNGRIVVPGGETRPGVRSTEVWAATVTAPKAQR